MKALRKAQKRLNDRLAGEREGSQWLPFSKPGSSLHERTRPGSMKKKG